MKLVYVNSPLLLLFSSEKTRHYKFTYISSVFCDDRIGNIHDLVPEDQNLLRSNQPKVAISPLLCSFFSFLFFFLPNLQFRQVALAASDKFHRLVQAWCKILLIHINARISQKCRLGNFLFAAICFSVS